MAIHQLPQDDDDRPEGKRRNRRPENPGRFLKKGPADQQSQHRRGRNRQLQNAVGAFQERIFIRPLGRPAFHPE